MGYYQLYQKFEDTVIGSHDPICKEIMNNFFLQYSHLKSMDKFKRFRDYFGTCCPGCIEDYRVELAFAISKYPNEMAHMIDDGTIWPFLMFIDSEGTGESIENDDLMQGYLEHYQSQYSQEFETLLKYIRGEGAKYWKGFDG